MERKEKLQKLYNQARLAGLCQSQKEFSELLHINNVSISRALNGDPRYLTDSLLSKIEKLFADKNIQTIADNHGTINQQNQKNFTQNTEGAAQIDKLLDLLKEKDSQINRLLTIIEKMQ